jgi:two-component system sensor histidine kinase BaeS
LAAADGSGIKSSLTRNILLTVALVIVLGNFLGAAGVNWLFRSRYRGLEQEHLQRQGQTAARLLEDYWLQHGSWDHVGEYLDRYFTAPGHGRHMRRDPPPILFYLLDVDGTLLYLSPGLPPRVPGMKDSGGFALTAGGQSIGRLIPVAPDNLPPRPSVSFFLGGLNLAFFMVTLLSTLLILLVGSLVIRRWLRPLGVIADGVKKIGAGDYSVRLSSGGVGELKVLEREFNRMAEAVGAADEWKKRLVSDTAHDLRTPLSLLTGQVEMIRDGIYPPDAERLGRIHEELHRLGLLVAEMEELARLESAAIPLVREEFPAAAPAREALSLFAEKSRQRDITLELIEEGGGQIPMLSADYGKVLRVLRNLLDNALTHTPSGGRITIHTGTGYLSVEDTGPGIPPGEEERIFRRFYRVDSSRNRATGGSGLGLAICRAVMEAHGGTITAGNNPEVGARFTLKFGR